MTADFSLEPPPQQVPVPQPEPRRPVLGRPVAVGLIGLLVGAFLVGVPWLVLSLLGGPSGQAPTAPANLGGLSRAEEAMAKIDKVKGQSMIARVEKADRETGAAVSAAYGGAGAVVQEYRDDKFARGIQLIAVRAPSPELFAPYQDAAALGMAKPDTELVRVGDVQCLLHNDPAAVGSTPDPDQSFVTSCQRSGPGLTVTIRTLSREGNGDPHELAGIVKEAWGTLSR